LSAIFFPCTKIEFGRIACFSRIYYTKRNYYEF